MIENKDYNKIKKSDNKCQERGDTPRTLSDIFGNDPERLDRLIGQTDGIQDDRRAIQSSLLEFIQRDSVDNESNHDGGNAIRSTMRIELEEEEEGPNSYDN